MSVRCHTNEYSIDSSYEIILNDISFGNSDVQNKQFAQGNLFVLIIRFLF